MRWTPDHLLALFDAEGLTPDDLDGVDAGGRQRLVKDLFLLGLQEEMRHGATSLITRFARSLLVAPA